MMQVGSLQAHSIRPRPGVTKPLVRFGQHSNVGQQAMDRLAQQYPVIRLMFDMIDIPSATPQPDPRHKASVDQNLDRVRQVIARFLQTVGNAQVEQNEFGSLIVRVPGSPGLENARPLMLTAHTDIVPGDPNDPTRPVKRMFKVINGREYITSDGTTTLGADDKGGLAMILDNVARLNGKPHVPLEIVLSPDEESSCDSLKKLDTSKFKAKHVLVVDEFKSFRATTGLASAVPIEISIQGTHGGHSGEDINKPNRLNAIALMGRLVNKLGTGVVSYHPQHPQIPFISKNLGLMRGGVAPNGIPESASATYMLRSFGVKEQEAELARMQRIVANYQRRHKSTQPTNFRIAMKHTEEYPAWQADPKSILPPLLQQASKAMNGPKVEVGPTHAAAQASILANKTNAYGERFDAVLIGPHIEEAHTVRERVDWKSVVEVNDWLGRIIDAYTRQAAATAKPTHSTANPFR